MRNDGWPGFRSETRVPSENRQFHPAAIPDPRIQPPARESIPNGESPMDHRVRRGEVREDQITSWLEKQTAQVPSSTWLGASLASMVASLAFRAAGREHAALFVGQWAAPFLLIGIYNKMVKQHGSDATSDDSGSWDESTNRAA